MKYTYNYIIMFMLAFALSSCEREIDFNSNDVKPKLVLHCFPSPNTPMMLTLRTSRFFLSNDEIRDVPNAIVTVWKNGTLVETLKYTSSDGYKGMYFGNFCPAVGDEITIKASAPGFDDIFCSEIMPPPPVISDVEHTDILDIIYNIREYFDVSQWKLVKDTLGINVAERYNLICRIKDSDEANYYRINIYEELENHYLDGSSPSMYKNPLLINSTDIVFGMRESELFESEENPYNIFSDELFAGKEYSLKCNVENWFNNNFKPDYPGYPIVVKRNMCVELSNLSKAYYLYLRTRTAGDRVNIFSEPVQIYSNVVGGIGVLAPSAAAVYKFPLIVK